MPAFAGAIGTSPAPPPPPAARPRPVVRPQPTPQPRVKIEPKREAEAGPVPYFAPVGSCASPNVGFPVPVGPLGGTATSRSVPWGAIVTLGFLVAVLAGGYFFLFGKSSAFSPEDGSYSVTLPDGWKAVEELDGTVPGIDAAVQTESEQSAIMVGHYPVPAGMGKDQLRAGMTFAQQFMPAFPGLRIGPFQESNVVAGEGVSSYEMTAAASGASIPGGSGKVRMVFAVQDDSTSLAMLVVACADAECADAEAKFLEVAKTFEFSG